MLRRKLMRGLGSSVAAIVLCSGSLAAGSVIYVNAAAPNGGNGSMWAMAFNNLHVALAGAQAGDEIWVAGGVYKPAPPYGSREISFQLKGGVALYGGFAGWETELDQRDWIANETILSGDLNGNDQPGFQYMGENSYHVLYGELLEGEATIDGFVIQSGNASDYGAHWRGGGILVYESDLVIRNCMLRYNLASEGAGAFISDGDPVISSCTFESNWATWKGGGLRFMYCNVITLEDCVVSNNTSQAGAGMIVQNAPYATSTALMTLTDCSFIGNTSETGGASAYVTEVDELTITRCKCIANSAEIGGGGMMLWSQQLTVIDSSFIANDGGMFGGGFVQLGQALYVNCVFSGNSAMLGGGIYCSGETQVINCSFSNNEGNGIVVDRVDEDEFHFIANSVFWGNTPEQVVYEPDPPKTLPTICYSDIQGGWSGPGWNNIDADPLFVQPGADDLRLAFGSPCLDVGDNSALPDWVETDLAGNPRIINNIVDMGAYEGEYEPLPPAAVDYDIDQGEFTTLTPDAGEFNPVESSSVVLLNRTGPDNATAIVEEADADLHPGAGGFSETGAILAEETSLQAGQFSAFMYLAFDAGDLDGTDPLLLNLTCFDETTGNWALAVSANTQNSPGYEHRIGDRIVSVAPDGWGTTNDPGDYGVFWDPTEQKGFVWANLDYAGDFGVGTALHPEDCAQPPDGFVNLDDLLFILDGWGRHDGPFDVNGDGKVSIDDVFVILGAWGACS